MVSLRTPRLLLRPFRASDAESLHAIRNDPTTAEYQTWTLPYALEAAREIAESLAAMAGPSEGEWFGLVIADPGTGAMLGDVVAKLSWRGRTAEIGVNLAPGARGRGYAREAAAAWVEWLFEEQGVQRVEASLHPDNAASAMLLETLGFLYEGTARRAFWVGEECSDDARYGLLRDDWRAWLERPREAPLDVQLVEITEANMRAVHALRTHRSQERFVSTMAGSWRDMAVPIFEGGERVVPWARAVEADGVVVGFVMLAEPCDRVPAYLWRLLIDRLHQRRGIGGRVVDLVADQARAAWGSERLRVSWVPGRGSPEPLYLRRGFVPTGDIDDGEIVADMVL